MAPNESDSQTPPLLNDRATGKAIVQQLEHLNQAFEEQKVFMKAMLSPSQKQSLEETMRMTASKQRSMNAPGPLPPSITEMPGGQLQMGDTQREQIRQEAQDKLTKNAENLRKVVLPAEVGPLQRIKQGLGSLKRGEGFSEGFLEPEKTKKMIFEPGGGTNALPPNAVDSDGVSYNSGIPGDTREPSPIRGMTMAEYQRRRREGFKIPQFGDWQLDTKLRMGSDWLSGLAEPWGEAVKNPATGKQEWQPQPGMKGKVASGLMNMAGYLNYGAEHAAQIQVLKNMAGKASGWLGETSEMGSYMGYNPQNGAGPNYILGVRNPLAALTSEAGQQGLGMRWDAYNMSTLGTGLSGGQSKEIVNTLAKNGWSNNESNWLGMMTGGNLNNIATQGVAPLVKNTGMSGEVAAGLYEPLRYGNTSIEQLRNSLTGLSEAAQAAHMNINAAGQVLQEFAAEQGDMGGTAATSYQTGIQWMQNTNMSPSTLAKMQANPFYQGLAMTKAGVLPSAIGGMTGGTQERLATQSLKMLMGATKGLAKPVNETVNGKTYQIESGEKVQIAQVAQMMGISTEEAEKLIRNEKQELKNAKVETVLNSESGWANWLKRAESYDKKHGLKEMTSQQRAMLQRGGEGMTGWNSVEQTLKEAGMGSKELYNVSHESFNKRKGDVEKFLRSKGEEEAKATGQKVEVKFTGAAAKYFEQVPLSPAKAGQNAGGNLLSEASAGVMTLSQMTGGYTNPLGATTGVAGSILGVAGKLL